MSSRLLTGFTSRLREHLTRWVFGNTDKPDHVPVGANIIYYIQVLQINAREKEGWFSVFFLPCLLVIWPNEQLESSDNRRSGMCYTAHGPVTIYGKADTRQRRGRG
jgi:hypothetical protein